MRVRSKKSLMLAVLLLGGPTVLLLFSQLRGNLAPIRAVQDPYPVFADIAVDPDSNIVAVAHENKFSRAPKMWSRARRLAVHGRNVL